MKIGCDDDNRASEHLQDMLDELRISKRALLPAEIQVLP